MGWGAGAGGAMPMQGGYTGSGPKKGKKKKVRAYVGLRLGCALGRGLGYRTCIEVAQHRRRSRMVMWHRG